MDDIWRLPSIMELSIYMNYNTAVHPLKYWSVTHFNSYKNSHWIAFWSLDMNRLRYSVLFNMNKASICLVKSSGSTLIWAKVTSLTYSYDEALEYAKNGPNDGPPFYQSKVPRIRRLDLGHDANRHSTVKDIFGAIRTSRS